MNRPILSTDRKESGTFTRLFASLLICLLLATPVQPQTVADIEQLLKDLEQHDAAIFSPDQYERGVKAFERANGQIEDGKDASRIERSLAEAHDYLTRARETIDAIESRFSQLPEAYRAALAVQAEVKQEKTWKKAFDLLEKAVARAEKGDYEGMTEPAAEAATLFRQAEYEIIRTGLLASAYDLQQEADALNSPVLTPGLYNEAVTALRDAETYLEAHRYDREAVEMQVDEISEIFRHAIGLSRWIARIQEDTSGVEDLILQFEWYIEDIAAALNLSPRMDSELTFAVDAILAAIRALEQDRDHLESQLVDRDRQIGQLEAQLGAMRGQTGKYLAELEVKRQEIQARERFEAKIARVTTLIPPQEGSVFRATTGGEEQIVIRLTAMNFKSGSAELQPETFATLTRVHQVMREFPDWTIEVQGHTDAKGSEEKNLELSQQRADAVRDYFITNMEIAADRIQAQGYGESNPLASNETATGRAKNRRIEIILKKPTY